MKFVYKILPWCLVALFAAEIIAVFMPKSEGEFHIREFGRLPVLMNGRIQPFDSVGRNTLLQIRSTGEVPLEQVPSWKFWHHPKKLRSSEWLLEVFYRPEVADTRPIFLIHHPELLAELNLTGKGVERSGLNYFTFQQLEPVLTEIQEQGNRARQLDDKQRTAVQKQAVKLHHAVFVYQMMKAAARPPGWNDFAGQLAAFETNLPAGMEAMREREAGQSFNEEVFNNFWRPVSEFFSLARDSSAGQTYPLVVPPWRPDQKHEDWSSMGQALLDSVREERISEPVKLLAGIASGFARADAAAFNQSITDYKAWLQQGFPKEVLKGRKEFFFNDTKSFLHAMIIYLLAFLVAAGSLLTLGAWPGLSESLRRSAFYLVILAGAVHTFGLVFRMHLEGRPPVTNLYSSAIFIGWGTMILGLILERIYKLGLGSLMAAVVGFVTLIIAQNLSLGGDTMEMMRAVLDTNFWLATHVVTIAIGYSAAFAAGFLAIVYVCLGLFTRLLNQRSGAVPIAGTPNLSKAIAKMVYAIVCFATLFSFIGTVLGGIWADQSWGRFWGWDPKENGALLIVLWNAVILHARWGGMIRERGLMNMAIFGNIITAFSWFGVNMLGIGLHSYGFMDAAFKWLVLFMISQAIIIAFGLIPLKYWRSFRTPTQAS